MRVLIVTGVFGGPTSNPWLLDDLAEAFLEGGDTVDVVVNDTKNPWPPGLVTNGKTGLKVFSVGPSRILRGRIGKIANIVAGFVGLYTRGYIFARKGDYDLCVYTSIGIFSWGFPAVLREKQIVRRSVFILWDFFPIHQIEINRISHWWPAGLLRWAEALTFRNADAVALMSHANDRFFRKYHSKSKAPVIIIPPWASGAGQPESPAKRERFTVVFGGQLARGRGVHTLLQAGRLLQQRSVDVDILIVGDGPSRKALESLATALNLDNTTFLGSVSREAYRELLGTAHVGVAITVSGVTPPTFPSKIAEYSATGIPVIVSVESSSDAGSLVEGAGAGLSVAADDPEALAEAIIRLAGEHRSGAIGERGRLARRLYEDELSVGSAVRRLQSRAHDSSFAPEGDPVAERKKL